MDGANKTGGKFEDAIENAIISMNEPKQVSVSGLRDYLSEWETLPPPSNPVFVLQVVGTTTTTLTTSPVF